MTREGRESLRVFKEVMISQFLSSCSHKGLDIVRPCVPTDILATSVSLGGTGAEGIWWTESVGRRGFKLRLCLRGSLYPPPLSLL